MTVEIKFPAIVSAAFSPNPVTAKETVVLTVKVTEVLKTLEPETRYSGELYAGEV